MSDTVYIRPVPAHVVGVGGGASSDDVVCLLSTSVKHPVPDRVKPSFVIFDIRSLWPFIAVTIWQHWAKMVNRYSSFWKDSLRIIDTRWWRLAVCTAAVKIKSGREMVVGSDVHLVAGKKSVFKKTGLTRSDLRGRKIFYVKNAANCHCEALVSGQWLETRLTYFILCTELQRLLGLLTHSLTVAANVTTMFALCVHYITLVIIIAIYTHYEISRNGSNLYGRRVKFHHVEKFQEFRLRNSFLKFDF